MNSKSKSETGGASIKPSARPSIHAHRQRVDREGMGVYGLNGRNRTGEPGAGPSSNDQGTDEVDNVMSKYVRASSPVPVRHPNRFKRNSFDTGIPAYEDVSDDDKVFVKSLPANLPSRLNSSDEFGDWQVQKIHNSSLASSNGSAGSERSRDATRFERSELESSTNRSHLSNLSTNQENVHQNKNKTQQICIISVFLVVVSVVAVRYDDLLSAVQGISNHDNLYDQFKFYNDLDVIGEKYRISDDSILKVQSGISTIFKRQDAGSFIFMYNSIKTNFDPVEFNSFMYAVASTAARYLRNESVSVLPTLVDSSKLYMKNHSELINEYRQNVTRTGVMLVKELDRVPPALAMAFHYYCDEFNPLVKKSAIFFTLDLAKCSANSAKQQSAHAHIEQCLAEKWNGVPKDNIGPLLTRVVSTVVDTTIARAF